MDSPSAAPRLPGPDAIEFVRFCYRRKRVGWPELYDEMCAVASRALFRGYDADDLGGIGIGLCLGDMPGLAAIVGHVIGEEQQAARRTGAVTGRSAPHASDRPGPAEHAPDSDATAPVRRLVAVQASA